MASKTARGRKISKALKRYHSIVRQIAKKEKLSYADARGRYGETFIEAIRRGGVKTFSTWIRVTPEDVPGRWKRIKPEDIPKARTIADAAKLSYGRRKPFDIVRRSIGGHQYWNLVNRIAQMFDLSVADARRLLSRMQEEMTRTARAHGKKGRYRARDAAAVLEFSDRYQNVRMEFGI